MEWAGRTLVPDGRDTGFSSAPPVVRCMCPRGDIMTNRLQELLDADSSGCVRAVEAELDSPVHGRKRAYGARIFVPD